jgi:hypothetical protein
MKKSDFEQYLEEARHLTELAREGQKQATIELAAADKRYSLAMAYFNRLNFHHRDPASARLDTETRDRIKEALNA